jgi:hypothetical protein
MDKPSREISTRRAFLRSAAFLSGAAAAAAAGPAHAAQEETTAQSRRPNILMICADQFRADFAGANHENPSVRTPHIDALANRGIT